MANIIGKPFPDYVDSQIEARQYMLGLKNRPIDVTRYLINRMPWVRMTSTTDLGKGDNPNSVLYKLNKLYNNSGNFKGSDLRKNLILQNFPKYIPPVIGSESSTPSGLDSYGFNKGVDFTGDTGNEYSRGAYGFGGANERGYVPPPGITKMDIQYQNNGGLAKVNLLIKVYSQQQFALIDTLYMRPGYQALIEFGWSIYYKNPSDVLSEAEESNYTISSTPNQNQGERIYKTNNFKDTISPEGFQEFGKEKDTEAFEGIIRGMIYGSKTTPYNIYNAINRDRRKYQGNYDGVLGKVNNFKWNLEVDGSYSIQLQIQSLGDVIESLKANVGAGEVALGGGGNSSAASPSSYINLVENERKVRAQYDQEDTGFIDEEYKVVSQRFRSSFNKFLFDLNVAMFAISKGNVSKAIAGYPSFISKKAESLNTKSGKSHKTPLIFSNFPRPYKAVNVTSKNVSGLTTYEKDIVKDRSTPTTFMDMNGAIILESGLDKEINRTYISFSSLCAYIQNNLILYDFTGGNKTPIFWFDDSIYNINSRNINNENGGDPSKLTYEPKDEGFNYKYYHSGDSEYRWKDKIYMFTFPGQFSSRPDICVIPIYNLPDILDTSIGVLSSGHTNATIQKLSDFNTPDTNNYSPYVADLGAVYFNTAYLADKLVELNVGGELAILEFLQNIISDMTNSLGNVNNISVFVSEEGQITFQEDRPQKFGYDEYFSSDYTELNVFGVKPGDEIVDSGNSSLAPPQGSIVRDFGLSTTLPTSQQTTLVAAAQGNPNQPSSTSTAFGEYNIGLTDSLLFEKANNVPEQTGNFEGEFYAEVTGSNYTITDEQLKRSIRIKDFVSDNKPFLQIANKFYGNVGGKRYTSEELRTLQEFNTQYSNLIEGELSKSGQVKSNFFLPFNLKLTLDGISGIKLFNKFIIEDKALPPSYGAGGIDIIVKGVSHTIDQNGWITELDTQATAVRKLRDASEISTNTETTFSPPQQDVETTTIDGTNLELATTSYPGTILRVKNLVAKFESNGVYTRFNMGRRGVDGASNDALDAYPAGGVSDITTQTFEWVNTKYQLDTGLGNGYASGKYQIVPNTLKSFLVRHPEFKTRIFNQTNQELLGDYLFTEKRSSAGDYLLGKNNGSQNDLENAVQQVGQEFASMPVIYHQDDTKVGDVVTGDGKAAFYGGQGINPDISKITVATMVIALIGSRIDKTGVKNPEMFIPTYYVD